MLLSQAKKMGIAELLDEHFPVPDNWEGTSLGWTLAGRSANIFEFRFDVAATSLVIGYCLGVLFTFLVVLISSWRPAGNRPRTRPARG